MSEDDGAKECAIADCHEPAAGLMEWPDIFIFIYLCQRHADFVGAIEANLPPMPMDSTKA